MLLSKHSPLVAADIIHILSVAFIKLCLVTSEKYIFLGLFGLRTWQENIMHIKANVFLDVRSVQTSRFQKAYEKFALGFNNA